MNSILAILLFAGPYKFHFVDKEIKPYYDEYINIANKYCSSNQLNLPNKIAVQFDTIKDQDVIGLCERGLGYFVVTIDDLYWYLSETTQKKQVVFHELTHCILKKSHVQDENHFMYESLKYIPEKILYKQVEDMLNLHCRL